MERLGFLLKTYGVDLPYVRRLLKSFGEYNSDNLKLFIVSDPSTLREIERFGYQNLRLIPEDVFKNDLLREGDGVTSQETNFGYLNQALIKLIFHRLQYCEFYFAIDSDLVFSGNFFERDFFSESGMPLLVVTQDRALAMDPYYFGLHWVSRQQSLALVRSHLRIDGVEDFHGTAHGHQLFSASSLESLETWLKQEGITFQNAILISGYEFSWYTFFVCHYLPESFSPREPFVLTCHSEYQHLELVRSGVCIRDINRSYLGYVINSNYSRWCGAGTWDEWPKYLVSWRYIKISFYINLRLILRKVSPCLLSRRILSWLKRFRSGMVMRA